MVSLHSHGLCWLVLFAAICIGAYPEGKRPSSHPWKDPYLVEDDLFVRHVGTWGCFVIVIVRFCLTCVPQGVLKNHAPCMLNKCELFTTLLLFLAMTAVRIGIYLETRKYNTMFSDHVFLLCCMNAMVGMELKHCEMVIKHDSGHILGAWLATLVAWCLLAAMAVEAWCTARYYHTREASFLAFACGLILWGGLCFWWRRLLDSAYEAYASGSKTEILLKGSA